MPDVHKFNQRTFHVRFINLCISDNKSAHKITHQETPREHIIFKEAWQQASLQELREIWSCLNRMDTIRRECAMWICFWKRYMLRV